MIGCFSRKKIIDSEIWKQIVFAELQSLPIHTFYGVRRKKKEAGVNKNCKRTNQKYVALKKMGKHKKGKNVHKPIGKH